ncbi:MAG: cyclopropane-fatty-acyl-phospholipid synthase [Gammaproteobacteria bacterium]|jgi:cyclopropane-fatty-acyl-phospholipid synthase
MSVEAKTVLPVPLRGGSMARIAREAMRRRLRELAYGQLTVRDSWGTWLVGTPDGEVSAHIHVIDSSFYLDVALEGSLGAARAWMDGRWHSDDPTSVLRLMLRNVDVMDRMDGGLATITSLAARLRHAVRRNSATGSRRNIHAHYDLGNDFFSLFLDESMTYSCAIFEHDDTTLEQAQFAKLERICRKLAITSDDHVLEIGTGWGSFATHAARHHGCRVTTTTISAEQHALATARVQAAGLKDRVTVLLQDYRALEGKFDKLVSIEMIEAVGHAYLPTFFAACSRLLRDDGAMLLQGITMPDQRYARYLKASDFIQEYVFPGSCCPALYAMLDAVRGHTDLRVAHLEDIGLHYARTLRAWHERFDARADEVRALGYPERFMRMWRYYLAYCEAGFAERYTGTVQLLLEKPSRRAPTILGELSETPGLSHPAQDRA